MVHVIALQVSMPAFSGGMGVAQSSPDIKLQDMIRSRSFPNAILKAPILASLTNSSFEGLPGTPPGKHHLKAPVLTGTTPWQAAAPLRVLHYIEGTRPGKLHLKDRRL